MHPSARYVASALLAASQSVGAQSIDPAGAASLVWAECQAGQVEVMILGTFHFAQSDDIDVLEPPRQAELAAILDRLEAWAPRRVAVEYAHSRQSTLDSLYGAFLEADRDAGASANEIVQIGFRLARRLGHERVHAADVPMNLWHDSIQVFDDGWPDSRSGLRAKWPQRFLELEASWTDSTLAAILRGENRDAVPGNSEMYGGFLPLVEDEVYAGALKLRPWYDRNLRIVQNLFRIADPAGERVLLVIGSGHLRVLKQIMEMTPQLCAVSALPTLEGLP